MNGTTNYTSPITFGAFVAGRSSGSTGNQLIIADELVYVNYQNFKGWQAFTDQLWHGTMAPGQGLSVPQSTFNVWSGRYYHTALVIEWYTADGSRLLGRTSYDDNSLSDYTTLGTVFTTSLAGSLGLDPV